MAMNAIKTESRQYNLATIITVDTIRSSAGRGYLDKAVNYHVCARDHREGPVVIQGRLQFMQYRIICNYSCVGLARTRK